MRRPRWHDFVIVIAVLGLFATGVMALWGDDVRGWFGSEEAAPGAVEPKAPAAGPDPGVAGGA